MYRKQHGDGANVEALFIICQRCMSAEMRFLYSCEVGAGNVDRPSK